MEGALNHGDGRGQEASDWGWGSAPHSSERLGGPPPSSPRHVTRLLCGPLLYLLAENQASSQEDGGSHLRLEEGKKKPHLPHRPDPLQQLCLKLGNFPRGILK